MKRLRDPVTGQEYIRTDDGEIMEAPQVGVELRPFGFGTGVELPDALSAGLIQAGGSIERMGQGLQSGLNSLVPGSEIGKAALESGIVERARERQQSLAALGEEFPVASFVGQVAPGLATMALPGGMLTQGAIGAAQGMLEYDPDRSAIERGITGGAFGVGGAGLGILGGKAMKAIGDNGQVAIRGARQLAAQRLKDAGGFVTKGEQIGSDVVRQAELSLARNPATSRVFLEGAEQNKMLMNSKVARAIGLDPDALPGGKITEEALAQAEDKLTDVFQGVERQVGGMDMGEAFGKKLMVLQPFRVQRELGHLKGLPEGNIEPGEYIRVRRALSTAFRKASKDGDDLVMDETADLLEQLDNQAEAYLLPEGARAFGAARERWRNLAIAQMSGVVSGGDVSPKILGNRLGNNWGKTFKQGRMDRVLPETADMMRTVKLLSDPNLRPIAGSSGTGETLLGDALWKSLTKAARGDKGAIRDLSTEYGAGTLYNSLSPGALDVLFRDSPDIFGRVGAKVGTESRDRP